jgi:hypothetical protein
MSSYFVDALSQGKKDSGGDVLLIGDKNDYKVDMKEFKRLARELKRKEDIPIKVLDLETFNTFTYYSSFLREMKDTPVYGTLVDIIQDIFSDVQDTKKGTIGDYFVGCFRENKFPGSQACSDRCAGNLQPAVWTHGWETCGCKVYFHEPTSGGPAKGKETPFTLKVDNEGDEAMVHVNSDFVNFTAEELEFLREEGIKTVTIVISKGGGYEIVVPKIKLFKLEMTSKDNKKMVKGTKNSGGTEFGGGAILFLIVVVFIIIACCIAKRR